MAIEASVAPKERVNIVYRPATSRGKEEVELPLKLLVVGDFAARSGEIPLEGREPVNIDRDSFNEVLKAQEVSVRMPVPNRLVEGGAPLQVELRIGSLKDLEPDRIVAQVPELSRLLELRRALQSLKGPLANLPEFRRKIQDLVADQESRQRLLAEMSPNRAKEEQP